jgi:hypothetical protein
MFLVAALGDLRIEAVFLGEPRLPESSTLISLEIQVDTFWTTSDAGPSAPAAQKHPQLPVISANRS